MMGCAQYRRSMLADPHGPDPLWRAPRAPCHDCSLYSERLLRFESRLERALRVALPSDAVRPAAKVVPLRSPASRGRCLAMAASGLMALALAGGVWLSAPGPSLAADVVSHMREEPQAWRRTDAPVPGPRLEAVLRDSHLRLATGTGAGMVSYASSCLFRGHRVPHLVMQTEAGPATVMVLVHEHVSK